MQKYIIVGRLSSRRRRRSCTPQSRGLHLVDALSLDTDETRTKMAVTYEAVRRWRERLNQRRCTTDTFTMDSRLRLRFLHQPSRGTFPRTHVVEIAQRKSWDRCNSRKTAACTAKIYSRRNYVNSHDRFAVHLRFKCSRLARECLAKNDMRICKATIVRGNLAICIIFRCLSRVCASAR